MISKDEDGQTYLVSFGTPTNFVGWKNKVTSITVNGTAYTEAGWFGMSENQFKWETDGYGNQVLKLKVDSEFDENADNTFTIKAEGYKDLALPLVVNVIKLSSQITISFPLVMVLKSNSGRIRSQA